MFLLIDVIVWDIKIKLQAQILKLYALQTTDWTTFLRDIWIENANEILQLFVQERRVVQSWV